MYAHTNNSSYAQSSCISQYQQYYPNVSSYYNDLDTSNHETIMHSGGYGNTSSSSSCLGSGSPSSPLSCCSSNHHPPNCSSSPLLQRSFSCHSLQVVNNNNNVIPCLSHDLDSVTQGFDDILSHHHYHRHHNHNQGGSSMGNNESTSSIIEGMSKACRYSPEEKKERIERYRNKRNQRNFTKKIQYACRKTLADSRPRIRGRFARNDELETTCSYFSDIQQQNGIAEEEEYYYDNNNNNDIQDEQQWIHLLDYISSNLAP